MTTDGATENQTGGTPGRPRIGGSQGPQLAETNRLIELIANAVPDGWHVIRMEDGDAGMIRHGTEDRCPVAAYAEAAFSPASFLKLLDRMKNGERTRDIALESERKLIENDGAIPFDAVEASPCTFGSAMTGLPWMSVCAVVNAADGRESDIRRRLVERLALPDDDGRGGDR